MRANELEQIVLEKLETGMLDGVVGKDFQSGSYATVTFRMLIKDGIPQQIRIGADRKYFDNRENVRVEGKKSVEQLYESRALKLLFLQKYGWLMSDPDVREYSAFFKPKK